MNRELNNKIWIKGLTMECPHGTAARNCPLRQLRGLTEMDANRTIDEMDDREVSECLSEHRKCYAERQYQWGDPVC